MHGAQADYRLLHAVPLRMLCRIVLALAAVCLSTPPPAMAEENRPAPRPAAPPARPAPEMHQAPRPAEHFESGVHADAFAGPQGGVPQHYAFSGHDVRYFNDHDRVVWQGGAWQHGYHHGRYGYWWYAGGAWYYYDAPVYPYPVAVSDTYYSDDAAEDTGALTQPEVPQAGSWYWCDDPPGYYPYVSTCSAPFRAVPAPPPPQ